MKRATAQKYSLTTPVLPDEEWDFRRLDEEWLAEAVIYEYARSQDWILRAAEGALPSCDREEKIFLPASELFACKRIIATEAYRRRWYERSRQSPPTGTPTGQTESADGSIEVFQIWARRSPIPGPMNPFVHHDRVLLLGLGFPKKPFSQNLQGFAQLEVREGLDLPAVYDLEQNIVRVSFPADHPIWIHGPSRFSDKTYYHIPEKNGQAVEISRNDKGYRKFALAIDFSRLDEELEKSFKAFLKSAREKYELPPAAKSSRLERGGVPSFLTVRYCQDALNALGAHRLVSAFSGPHAPRAAFDYVTERLKATAGPGEKSWFRYGSTNELQRAAKKIAKVAADLFGAAPDIAAGFDIEHSAATGQGSCGSGNGGD